MKSVAKKDDAVSPVIGTILLVAITVVLVAIVAAVVMGMVGNMGQSKVVGATATGGDEKITAMITGGADVGQLIAFNASATGPSADVEFNEKKGTSSELVGYPLTATTKAAGKYQVVITGKFADNTSQVLYSGSVIVTNTTTT